MSIAKGVALVTGASQGMGHAIALRLAADGYDIALNDLPAQEAALRITAEEVASRGRRVHCVLADVSSEKQVQTMVSDVVREFGGLDVVRTTCSDVERHNSLTHDANCVVRWSQMQVSCLKRVLSRVCLHPTSRLDWTNFAPCKLLLKISTASLVSTFEVPSFVTSTQVCK